MLKATAAFALLTLVLLVECLGQSGTGSVTGTWRGPWTNSKGEKGVTTIRITERPDGSIVGDEGSSVITNGRREGNRLMWNYAGQNGGCRDYIVVMELSSDGTQLTGNYMVTDHCGQPSTYTGDYLTYKRVGTNQAAKVAPANPEKWVYATPHSDDVTKNISLVITDGPGAIYAVAGSFKDSIPPFLECKLSGAYYPRTRSMKLRVDSCEPVVELGGNPGLNVSRMKWGDGTDFDGFVVTRADGKIGKTYLFRNGERPDKWPNPRKVEPKPGTTSNVPDISGNWYEAAYGHFVVCTQAGAKVECSSNYVFGGEYTEWKGTGMMTASRTLELKGTTSSKSGTKPSVAWGGRILSLSDGKTPTEILWGNNDRWTRKKE
ncbi:MAG: hypothetical protein JO314_00450 [Acidobacteria bacterium]|nr:hypothetical protein [Acidobacteriota bacterium]